MVSRESIIKYGTLALILFFIFEAFFPLLYAPQNPAQSPEPLSPEAVSLLGSGTTFANVTQLEYVGFAPCPSSAKADKNLSGQSGIRAAFYSSADALAIDFEPTAFAANISALVEKACGSPMFRTALLDVDSVTLRDGNKSQALSRESFRALASRTGLSGLRGFILPDVAQGERVNVTVSGRVDGGQLSGVSVQQVVRAFAFEPVLANASDAERVDVPDLNVVEQNESVDGEVNASELSDLNAS